MTWGTILTGMFLITILAYARLVWISKGNILGIHEDEKEDYKKYCKFKVTVELGAYPYEEVNNISKWLKTNCKARYWGKKLPKKPNEWEQLSMYFESKQDAIDFKLEWQ